MRGGLRAVLDFGSDGPRAFFAKELLRPLRHRQQADDALVHLDDAAFPFVQVDAERLSEPPRHIIHQAEPLGLFARRSFLVGFIFRFFLASVSASCILQLPLAHSCFAASTGTTR